MLNPLGLQEITERRDCHQLKVEFAGFGTTLGSNLVVMASRLPDCHVAL
jgi:hypothetical protein